MIVLYYGCNSIVHNRLITYILKVLGLVLISMFSAFLILLAGGAK